MTFTKTALGLVCLMALSACDGNPFANRNADDFRTSGNEVVGTQDPASAAYFEQAIGDRVLFEVDQSTLTADAQQVLDAQANWLLEYTSYTIQVEGHADEQGTREYNLALGARRASAVQNYLVSRGVADNRISTVTYGKERPIEICSTEACWSQNRRAVSVVNTGLSS